MKVNVTKVNYSFHCFAFLHLTLVVTVRYYDKDRIIVGGRGEILGSLFAGLVPLASQKPYPIKVYSEATYKSYLIQFWASFISLLVTLSLSV